MTRSSIIMLTAYMALLSGCAVYRDLHITEVGLREVEIYLDEPSDHTLNLQDTVLKYISSNGETNELALFGMIGGEKFIVVWEDSNFGGSTNQADFVRDYLNYDNDYVRGIRVPSGFFGEQTNTLSYAYRIRGRHHRGNITDKVDDVVKFGPGTRPDIGGTFTDTGDLTTTNATRTAKFSYVKGKTISRKFTSDGVVDRDSENDWRLKNESFGER